MFIVVYFLLFSNLLVVLRCQSPCPDYFRYDVDRRTNEIYGRVEIQRPPRNVTIQLRVYFSVSGLLPTKYVGKIELAKSQVESVKAIATDQPLFYNIHFPLQWPVPLLTGLFVNNYQHCIGQQAPGMIITTIFLEHSFDPLLVKPKLDLDEKYPMTPSYSGSTPRPPVDSPARDPLFDSTRLYPYQDENCGKSSGVNHSMANDSQTSPGQWPWLVAIFIPLHISVYRCSGNLITDRHILTAAQCMITNGERLPPDSLVISLGRYRLIDWHDPGIVTHEAREYIIHPEYTNRGSAHGDLAIVVLKERVQMSWRIKPVCLWTGAIGLEKIVGRSGYLVGWGKDENGDQEQGEPRRTLVPIVSQEDCFRSNLKFAPMGQTTSNKTFCAGRRDGTGLCNGDIGSGLMIHDQTTDRYYLRGILSFALFDEKMLSCDLSSYIVYADTAQFLDWIHKQIWP